MRQKSHANNSLVSPEETTDDVGQAPQFRTLPLSERNDKARARMSVEGQTEKNSVRANVFRFALELGHCSMQSALRICAISRLSRYKKSWKANRETLVVPASNIMRILLLVFQATPKSHQDDTVFRSAAPGGYSASGPVDQARQAEARRDLHGPLHRPN